MKFGSGRQLLNAHIPPFMHPALDHLIARYLTKLAGMKKSSDYRQGCTDGFQLGFQQARKESEEKQIRLEAEVEELRARVKTSEDQIFLVGRLLNQLASNPFALVKDSREVIKSMMSILESKGKL